MPRSAGFPDYGLKSLCDVCRTRNGPGGPHQTAHLVYVVVVLAQPPLECPARLDAHKRVRSAAPLSLAANVDPALLDPMPQVRSELLANRDAKNLGMRIRAEPPELGAMLVIAGQAFRRDDPVHRRAGRELAARQEEARAVTPERAEGCAVPGRSAMLRIQRLQECRDRAVRWRQVLALDELFSDIALEGSATSEMTGWAERRPGVARL